MSKENSPRESEQKSSRGGKLFVSSMNTENGICLDPTDPFEAAVIDMVEMNRRKRADYASAQDIFRNFVRVSSAMDMAEYTPLEDILAMTIRKAMRIVNLRGRLPENEAVQDSWIDLAVYATLGYAYTKQEAQK